jgi:FAD/FMN-containing dehydrogenase
MPIQELIKEIGRTSSPGRTHRTSPIVDSEGLAADLRQSIEGEVRFDAGSRALYAAGGANYRQVPIGIVIPKSVDDIVRTVAACRRYGAPILSRGGGTSLAGQICNVAVVMDMSKYLHHIVALDPAHKRACVQPGLVLDNLRNAAERYHLTFAPDPSTHNHCTLGGMIGNNSCGVHALMGGKTEENTEELDILTYDGLRMKVGPTSEEELQRIVGMGGRQGEIYGRLRHLRDQYADLIRARYPKIPRRVSGYNLNRLLPEHGFDVAKALVGTEGTCVTVLEATVRLVHSPPARTLVVLGYPDIYTACDHIMDILDYQPIGLEGMDDFLVQDIRTKGLHPENLDLLPEGRGWLLAEFGGETKEESDASAQRMMAGMKHKSHAPAMRLYDAPEVEHHVWKTRELGLGATARIPGKPDAWEGWEDSAVPPEKLGGYLRDLRALFDKYKYGCALYGHFGQGCIHTRIDFDFKTQDGIKKYRAFISEAVDLVVAYGGSLSGEHGDGQSRAEFLPKMFGSELIAGEDRLAVEVECSKGTYVRSLARDLAVALGTVGHLAALRRTGFGPLRVEQAVALAAVGAGDLPILSPRDALGALREFAVGEAEVERLRRGQQALLGRLPPPRPGEIAKVLGPHGTLVAVLQGSGPGGWRIGRVLNAPPPGTAVARGVS